MNIFAVVKEEEERFKWNEEARHLSGSNLGQFHRKIPV
jgi:hypothetical protein